MDAFRSIAPGGVHSSGTRLSQPRNRQTAIAMSGKIRKPLESIDPKAAISPLNAKPEERQHEDLSEKPQGRVASPVHLDERCGDDRKRQQPDANQERAE